MLTASYDIPFRNAALANWRIGTLITIQSGLPFTPQLAVNSLNNGGFQLPNRVGTGDLPASQQSYLRWFNTSLNPADPNRAFQLPSLYQYGDSGFDILRGPGLANTDLSLARDFAAARIAASANPRGGVQSSEPGEFRVARSNPGDRILRGHQPHRDASRADPGAGQTRLVSLSGAGLYPARGFLTRERRRLEIGAQVDCPTR